MAGCNGKELRTWPRRMRVALAVITLFAFGQIAVTQAEGDASESTMDPATNRNEGGTAVSESTQPSMAQRAKAQASQGGKMAETGELADQKIMPMARDVRVLRRVVMWGLGACCLGLLVIATTSPLYFNVLRRHLRKANSSLTELKVSQKEPIDLSVIEGALSDHLAQHSELIRAGYREMVDKVDQDLRIVQNHVGQQFAEHAHAQIEQELNQWTKPIQNRLETLDTKHLNLSILYLEDLEAQIAKLDGELQEQRVKYLDSEERASTAQAIAEERDELKAECERLERARANSEARQVELASEMAGYHGRLASAREVESSHRQVTDDNEKLRNAADALRAEREYFDTWFPTRVIGLWREIEGLRCLEPKAGNDLILAVASLCQEVGDEGADVRLRATITRIDRMVLDFLENSPEYLAAVRSGVERFLNQELVGRYQIHWPCPGDALDDGAHLPENTSGNHVKYAKSAVVRKASGEVIVPARVVTTA